MNCFCAADALDTHEAGDVESAIQACWTKWRDLIPEGQQMVAGYIAELHRR